MTFFRRLNYYEQYSSTKSNQKLNVSKQVHILNASLCVQGLYIMLHVKRDIGKKVVYGVLEPYHMALPGDGHLT